MPCRYDESPWEAEQRRKLAELDRVTKLLCYVCTRLGADFYVIQENPELVMWWAEHQIKDKARLDAEAEADKAERTQRIAAARKALENLSPEERDALKA